MGLPTGFNPRACPFCGSRHLLNSERPDHLYQVLCLFCQASGPPAKRQDDAWLAWNGQGQQAPSMFGAAQGVL